LAVSTDGGIMVSFYCVLVPDGRPRTDLTLCDNPFIPVDDSASSSAKSSVEIGRRYRVNHFLSCMYFTMIGQLILSIWSA